MRYNVLLQHSFKEIFKEKTLLLPHIYLFILGFGFLVGISGAQTIVPDEFTLVLASIGYLLVFVLLESIVLATFNNHVKRHKNDPIHQLYTGSRIVSRVLVAKIAKMILFWFPLAIVLSLLFSFSELLISSSFALNFGLFLLSLLVLLLLFLITVAFGFLSFVTLSFYEVQITRTRVVKSAKEVFSFVTNNLDKVFVTGLYLLGFLVVFLLVSSMLSGYLSGVILYFIHGLISVPLWAAMILFIFKVYENASKN